MLLQFPSMTNFNLFHRSYVQLGTKIPCLLKRTFPSKFHINESMQNLRRNQCADDWL